jgi:chemotaxis protein histidine kinase CheA
VRGLAGCTVLGDGSISLIIDVAKLIQDVYAAA